MALYREPLLYTDMRTNIYVFTRLCLVYAAHTHKQTNKQTHTNTLSLSLILSFPLITQVWSDKVNPVHTSTPYSTKLRGLSPRAEYTDRAAAAGRRS